MDIETYRRLRDRRPLLSDETYASMHRALLAAAEKTAEEVRLEQVREIERSMPVLPDALEDALMRGWMYEESLFRARMGLPDFSA